jgi:hypothetical protein
MDASISASLASSFLLLLNIHLPIKNKNRQTKGSFDGMDKIAGSSNA